MAFDTRQILLSTPSVTVTDLVWASDERYPAAAYKVPTTSLLFPYRGAFRVRKPDGTASVADANQMLLFNPGQDYELSHPVATDHAGLEVAVDSSLLCEMAPEAMLDAEKGFQRARTRIDARAQALVAVLRHSLIKGLADMLEAESLALTLVQRALRSGFSHAASGTFAHQGLVDRTKLLLAANPERRWVLADIAAAVGGSPVYLTQVFQEVEKMPLYRYQRQLRLARALDIMDRYDDLSALSYDLGFSSHSHFSAAFRSAFGRSPTVYRQTTLEGK
ncbi:helix-turn-helix transcriptional regulator [Kordiimonas sp.]|uniref:helix-turn-helix transcriptional regulator n=1 Tax=Kordiimonas sp. TaxID=1970157 RepID=UPI003A8E40C5